ncbi:50S ribosomal protein L24 [Aeromicrobium flavum]|uniref:Large ribosomal subunit protein uL24 n=1 Tax=Aeromicrobium flavum TaxID=416568 RepID=A0A512HSJ8_9ACTN|nr:50S ribosomal protein L24 [Aeromicrobium flavum]GEO88360.1 50S ribosomal protein L24 [Aeromicrobium flavum]
MARIRKGDQVKVIAGKDKGVEGKVINVLENDRVIVEGVNRVQKHTRAGQTGAEGGIITAEAAIHVSNIMLVVDADGGKTTTKVGSGVIDGKKTRISRKTGKEI